MYKDEINGFSLQLPPDWKDKYVAENGYFYNKKIYEKYDRSGRLFYIVRYEGELWTEEDAANSGPNGKLLLQGNGYTYILRTPTDYQGSSDKTLSAEYNKMHEQRESIYKTIAFADTKEPAASISGFKVIGGRFFTAEIPRDWTIRASVTKALSWDMLSGGVSIGSIDIIPFNAEKKPSDSKTMREYLSPDKKKLCCIRISLDKDKADQAVMEKIKGSFKFLEMYYNVLVALQTKANDYLANGGEKIFGKIEPGNPKEVIVHLMKYVPDDSAKGFHIENLNQTRIYKYKEAQIIPLVGQILKTYVDDSDCYFEGFFKSNPNYRELYFDFIIYKGELKLAFGHYV